MTETQDSGKTEYVHSDGTLNVTLVTKAAVEGFRAELLKRIDKYIEYLSDSGTNYKSLVTENKIRNIVATHKF